MADLNKINFNKNIRTMNRIQKKFDPDPIT